MPQPPAMHTVKGDIPCVGPGSVKTHQAWATFVVLVPLYRPEYITVQLGFPTTFRTASHLLQAARASGPSRAFPHLHPVVPQLSDDVAICVATPSWQPDAIFVCLDVTEVDQRLFAVHAPGRLSLQELLRFAALPEGTLVEVYAGTDSQPLQADSQVSVTTATITFVPAGAQPFHNLSLDQMLLDHHGWSADAALPRPPDRNSFCIVHGDSHVLLQTPITMQVESRMTICDGFGLDISSLQLTQARPRLSNAALDGFPCSVVAAGPKHTGSQVIVDCRQVLQGWKTYSAAAGLLDVGAALASLSFAVSNKTRLSFLEIPQGLPAHPVSSGAVLTAFYVLVDSPSEPEHDTSHSTPVRTDRQTDVSAECPQLHSFSSDPHEDGAGDPNDHDQGEHPPATIATAASFCTATFLVLVPECVPELLQLRLALPQTEKKQLCKPLLRQDAHWLRSASRNCTLFRCSRCKTLPSALRRRLGRLPGCLPVSTAETLMAASSVCMSQQRLHARSSWTARS